MKRLILVTLCALVLSIVGASAAGDDPKDEQAVKATMEAMAKATINKDVATLDKIYANDVTYSHSSGLTQTKAQVLKAFEGNGITESLKFSETTIRIYGPVALFKGITDMRNGAPGHLTDNHLNILWVLVKGPGPMGWQIVARQTTRIAERLPRLRAPRRPAEDRRDK